MTLAYASLRAALIHHQVGIFLLALAPVLAKCSAGIEGFRPREVHISAI